MLIVHIGLPKTGSTTLQKHVFPKLAEMKNLSFNDSYNLKLSKLHLRNLQTSFSIHDLNFCKEKTLISSEGLVGWNPAIWELMSERNLKFFGEDAKIIITLRDPLDYMRSVYQHMVQIGLNKSESNFFKFSKSLFPNYKKKYVDVEEFDLSCFDYSYLEGCYRNKFKHVQLVDLKDIKKMNFFNGILDLSFNQKETLKLEYLKSPIENQSFSRPAMKLAKFKNKIFNINLNKNFNTDVISVNHRNIDRLEKPSKIRTIFKSRFFQFRWLIHNIFDKFVPYKKFFLGNKIINEASVIIKNNRKFIRNLDEQYL